MPKKINRKILLWYICSVIIIVLAAIIMLISTQRQMTANLIETRLHSAVEIVSTSLEYTAVEDMTEPENSNVQILLYDTGGTLLLGDEPVTSEDPAFEAGALQQYNDGTQTCYFYDTMIRIDDGSEYRVRACYTLDNLILRQHALSKTALRLIPLILILAILFGLLLTRRTLAPIRQIRTAAEEITRSGDLTRRVEISKKTEDELTRLSETFNEMFDRIEHLFEQEKQLTSDAAHELRNPVSVILAEAEYLNAQLEQLQEEYGRRPKIAEKAAETADESAVIAEEAAGIMIETAELAEITETTEVILRQAGRMQKLVNDLLMIARMESPDFSVETEDLNFSELVETIAEETKEVTAARKIQIYTEIQPDIVIESSETLLIRVLMNLMNNAVKYGREGGWIRVTVSEEAGMVSCAIADNGIGIAPEDLDRIWDRFYTAGPAACRTEDSTGIGLFLVRRITEHLGGSITAESTLHEGSVFTLRLPVSRAQS